MNDGAVRWTEIAESGVTLITTTSSADPDAPEPNQPEEPKDLTLKEGAGLLAAGLASGALISVRLLPLACTAACPVTCRVSHPEQVGLKLFQSTSS